MNDQDLEWIVDQRPEHPGPDARARERALLALVRHTSSRPGSRRTWTGNPLRSRRSGLAALTGVAALAAVVIIGVAEEGRAGSPGRAAAPQQRIVTGRADARHPATHGRGAQSQGTDDASLVRLADDVSDSPSPSGDATLVARTTTTGGTSVTVYDLYADDGKYYFSRAESGLAGQVSAGDNLAGGLFAREVAAAKLAATGNVQTAAQDMADAPDPSHVVSPTQTFNRRALALKAKILGMSNAERRADEMASTFDNYVWENSQDALTAGSGQPQVRAGVLKILATLPGVTVTQGTTDGQPTLVLAAGTPELGYDYTEQLTINAETGVPIRFVGGQTGGTPATTVTYQVSRVTLANLGSGSGTTTGTTTDAGGSGSD